MVILNVKQGLDMTATAILSDIHGNARALEAVFNDIFNRKGIDRVVQLGDVVGYGPNPRECYDMIRAENRIRVHLLGNHDRNLLSLFEMQSLDLKHAGVNAVATEALQWTRKEFYGDHPWKWPAGYHEELLEQYCDQMQLDNIDIQDPRKGLFGKFGTFRVQNLPFGTTTMEFYIS